MHRKSQAESRGYGQADYPALALARIADECSAWALCEARARKDGVLLLPGQEFVLTLDAIPTDHRGYHIQAAAASLTQILASG